MLSLGKDISKKYANGDIEIAQISVAKTDPLYGVDGDCDKPEEDGGRFGDSEPVHPDAQDPHRVP